MPGVTHETRSSAVELAEANALPANAGAVRLEGVRKVYNGRRGTKVTALESVDLSIRPGEFVVLVGPSGCGKTTLLKIVAGLLSPSAGRVLANGREVNRPDPSMGMVFQQPTLLPWRTVLSNVTLPSEVRRLNREAARAQARDLLGLVGLAGFEDALPSELSGGMQQRVGICRALMNQPSLLLMDEPFAALDALTREVMSIELQRIWMANRTTVVFVTHSIPEAVLLADRIVVMTPRPAKVEAVIEVDLPRPRHLDDLSGEQGGALVAQIRHYFFEEARRVGG